MTDLCRVYWGSHGCRFVRGHEGTCECDCADQVTPEDLADPGFMDASRSPYYGPETRFYGEDAAARGLPLHKSEEVSDV